MRAVLKGIFYRGEPVFREYTHNATVVEFFSREIQRFGDGTWKFVRWIPLHKLKIDGRLGRRRIVTMIQEAHEYLLTLDGVTTS